MATTINLTKTINWTKPFLKNQGLDFSNMEPALTTGNMVMGTLISAPFKWRNNRGETTFPTQIGVCDYVRNLPDFGFLEDQWVEDSGVIHPLTGALSLPRATGISQRPTQIAAQNEDENGNITFRTKEMPGKIYNIGTAYQKKAPILKSLATSLAPWPDDFAFVFNWGFLTITCMLNNDARMLVFEKFFIGKLLGLQGGLSDVDRSIFLGNWATNMKTMFNVQSTATGAVTARQGA